MQSDYRIQILQIISFFKRKNQLQSKENNVIIIFKNLYRKLIQTFICKKIYELNLKVHFTYRYLEWIQNIKKQNSECYITAKNKTAKNNIL